MVVEELCAKNQNSIRTSIQDFHTKCTHTKENVTPIDITIRHLVKKLHILEINETSQIIMYQNLHIYPHYSVGNEEMIFDLLSVADFFKTYLFSSSSKFIFA